MHGVRVHNVKFDEFIGPILPELDQFFVYAAELSYPPALWRLDDDAEAREQARVNRELAALSLDAEPRFLGGIFRPGFLGRLSRCVRNDWNDLLLFRESPDSLVFADGRRGTAPNETAPTYVLQNWDASFWQLYSEDGVVLAKLRAAHAAAGRQVMDIERETDQPDPLREALVCRAEGQKRRGCD